MLIDQNFSSLGKLLPHFEDRLKLFDYFDLAHRLASLLVIPQLHANTLRIELLTELAVEFANGKKKAAAKEVHELLNDENLVPFFTYLEDPPEDVFVSNVTWRRGNYRIFEGIWECNDFFLQRILNVLEGMNTQVPPELYENVDALLRISENTAKRKELPRYSVGGGIPKGFLPSVPAAEIRSAMRSVCFDENMLQTLGISHTNIAPFLHDKSERHDIYDQRICETDITKKPLLKNESLTLLALPSAVSIAIRHYVLSNMIQLKLGDEFDERLRQEHVITISQCKHMSGLRSRFVPPKSGSVGGKTVTSLLQHFDAGRYIHLVLVVDSIQNYELHGLMGVDTQSEEIMDLIEMQITECKAQISKREQFQAGVSLIVTCGFGRPVMLRGIHEHGNWFIENVSVPDFCTLMNASNYSAALWKMLMQERFLGEERIPIENINGALNLYGYWTDLHESLLPPDYDYKNKPQTIILATNFMAIVRKKVRNDYDLHGIKYRDDIFLEVRRYATRSYLTENCEDPWYAPFKAVDGEILLSAWERKGSVWWVDGGYVPKNRQHAHAAFKIWEAALQWTGVISEYFEKNLPGRLPAEIVIALNLSEINVDESATRSLSCEEVQRNISSKADCARCVVYVELDDEFLGAFKRSDNAAERAIVRAIVRGALQLSDVSDSEDDVQDVVNAIVPNNDAKFFHVFDCWEFRDYISVIDPTDTIAVELSDEMQSLWGLGWKSGQHQQYTDAKSSNQFLNHTTEFLMARLRTKLNEIDRTEFVYQAFRYIEGTGTERRVWERTFKALSALKKGDKVAEEAAIRTMSRFTTSEVTLRILIEMALVYSPDQGGRTPGRLDFGSLMADARNIFELGGYSDAINKGIMDPAISVLPRGDILCDKSFILDISNPLGEAYFSRKLKSEAAKYDKYFEARKVKKDGPPTELSEQEFDFAFKSEFGIELKGLREFLTLIESVAIQKKECVFRSTAIDLVSLAEQTGECEPATLQSILKRFSLSPREQLHSVPPDCSKSDWYPWKFNRKLSLVSRPLASNGRPPGSAGVAVAV